MKKSIYATTSEIRLLALLVALLVCSTRSWGQITLYTTASGDAQYAWNSRFGPTGYEAGATTIGVGLQMGGSWGNDYTVGIFMVPIASLAGKTITSATLHVNSLGFDTLYFYGSATVGWLDTGSATLTGNVVADGLGPLATGRPSTWMIYDSDVAGSGSAGLKSFDASSYLQTDLTAGRSYSVFVLSGSRDTYGAISTAETGSGPYLVVSAIPEPSTYAAITALLALSWSVWRRKRS